MPWARIDDQANDDDKLNSLGSDAFRLWVRGLVYCQKKLTDGFIPDAQIGTLAALSRDRDRGRMIAELLAEHPRLGKGPLWHKVEGGYQMHDYLDWNESRAQVEASRQAASQRVALFRDRSLRDQIRARDGDRCRYCGRLVRWTDKKGDLGGTYDHVIPYGGNAVSNLVVCCRGCNSRKRNRTPEEAGMTLRPCGDPPPESNPTVNQIQIGFESGFESEQRTNNSPLPTYHKSYEKQERAAAPPHLPVEAVENRVVRFRRRSRSRETCSGNPSIRVITALVRSLLITHPVLREETDDEGAVHELMKVQCARNNLLYDSTSTAQAIAIARAQLRKRKDVPA